MDTTKFYINEPELSQSISLIEGYVSREENLLKNISRTLSYGFDGSYSSSNYDRLRSSCANLSYHTSIIANNNRKMLNTLRSVRDLYVNTARVVSSTINKEKGDIK